MPPDPLRILIWHGYLLGGTGSNVYTRSLARAWRRLGHDVVVLCQDPHPERFDLGGATVVRPDIGGLLPVFVLDQYEDLSARLLPQLSRQERAAYVAKNVSAIRQLLPADLLLANHVLLGAPVGAGAGVPFAVKAHGSELEFAMRGNAELCAWARDALDCAQLVLAGSEHIATVLQEVPGPAAYTNRVRVVPPGVDIDDLLPGERGAALAGLLEECRRDPPNASGDCDERRPDAGNADRFERFFAVDRPTVLYVGKLSAEKGVSLLLSAVRRLNCRAVIVGFGPARPELQASALEDLSPGQVMFAGPLEHRHLRYLWRLVEASVVPSVFPEAFGMVAAEAASCGCPPLVARHSGLAEIATELERRYPAGHQHLAGFRTGDADDLSDKLGQLLALRHAEWLELSYAARQAAVDRWSWRRVAAEILAAMV